MKSRVRKPTAINGAAFKISKQNEAFVSRSLAFLAPCTTANIRLHMAFNDASDLDRIASRRKASGCFGSLMASQRKRHVRFGSEADMCSAQADVRFAPIATTKTNFRKRPCLLLFQKRTSAVQ